MISASNNPTPLMRTARAADFLGLSPRTLEKHRTFGTGPAYRKIGGRVVYDLVDLRDWADRGVRRSTQDPADERSPQPARPSHQSPPV